MTQLRLLLADRVKGAQDSFLRPLMPALQRAYDTRFVSLGPGEELTAAIGWADIVWLEWCWDHAVWATQSGLLANKPTILRLHSIEALQTDFPARVDWSAVDWLTTVGGDVTDLLHDRFPSARGTRGTRIIPNGIDMARFAPGTPDRFRIGWVGHLEPKKNPMLLLQIAHQLRGQDPRYKIHVAGAFTDIRTGRYLKRMMQQLSLGGAVHFHGPVDDMPGWYADKGVLLTTSMYESFGLNIGEAMAVGAFPVVHDFPGADTLWPNECLFASIPDAIALIRSARPRLYREWVGERYGLERQVASVLDLLESVHQACHA